MNDIGSKSRNYMLAVAVGALGGGLLVAWAANAMPKMMSRMMQNMMTRMREEGCDPTEM